MRQAKKNDEFVYRGPIDIIYPCYKDALELFLHNTLEISSLHDAIMAFNCCNFLMTNRFNDWNDCEYEENKKTASQ